MYRGHPSIRDVRGMLSSHHSLSLLHPHMVHLMSLLSVWQFLVEELYKLKTKDSRHNSIVLIMLFHVPYCSHLIWTASWVMFTLESMSDSCEMWILSSYESHVLYWTGDVAEWMTSDYHYCIPYCHHDQHDQQWENLDKNLDNDRVYCRLSTLPCR